MSELSPRPWLLAASLQENLRDGSPVDQADPFNPALITTLVQQLEQHGCALVLLHDAPQNTQPDWQQWTTLGFEALTLAAWLACHSQTIGLVPVLNSNTIPPFSLARLVASLDHTSHGRAGWLLSASEQGNAAANYGQSVQTESTRLARHSEMINVVNALFDSWQDDALLRDKASGIFIDSSKLHFLNFNGQYFSVRGPLNVVRSPQGRPPLFLSLTATCRDQPPHPEAVYLASGLSLPALEAWRTAAQRHLATVPGVLKRVIPLVADTTALAHQRAQALQQHTALTADDQHDLFIGDWTQWQQQLAQWHQTAVINGVLLSLPAGYGAGNDHVRRLLANAPSPAVNATTLLSRLGLPRPENLFTAHASETLL